jgi:hypothetical protein
VITPLVSQATNRLRGALGPRAGAPDRRFFAALATLLKQNDVLAREPIVQCFIEDISRADGPPRLRHTKAHINEGRDHKIFSLFRASYFPSLGLDFVSYRPVEAVDDRFAAKFKSRTHPVTIEHMSVGFEARVVVALFPENHVDGIQDEHDAVFYFIDKFVARHDRITRRLLDAIVEPAAFPLVRGATTSDVARASSHWVWLHEYYHRQGSLPLPKYLALKTSNKPLSGLEELRVDMTGLLRCRDDCGLSDRDAELTAQFILAERLLRYAIEGIPHPNYDAVASQLLFNYLREKGGLELRNGLIHLTPHWHAVVARLVATIDAIERRIQTEAPARVAERLFAFVNEYTDYDPALDDYRHIDFFFDVKGWASEAARLRPLRDAPSDAAKIVPPWPARWPDLRRKTAPASERPRSKSPARRASQAATFVRPPRRAPSSGRPRKSPSRRRPRLPATRSPPNRRFCGPAPPPANGWTRPARATRTAACRSRSPTATAGRY